MSMFLSHCTRNPRAAKVLKRRILEQYAERYAQFLPPEAYIPVFINSASEVEAPPIAPSKEKKEKKPRLHPIDPALGRRIAEFRKRDHLKQSDVAPVLNVSPNQIGNIERGRNMPNLDQLKRLARLFRCELKHFNVPPGTPLPRRRFGKGMR